MSAVEVRRDGDGFELAGHDGDGLEGTMTVTVLPRAPADDELVVLADEVLQALADEAARAPVEEAARVPAKPPGPMPSRRQIRPAVTHVTEEPRATARAAQRRYGLGRRPVMCTQSWAPDLHGSRLTRRGKIVVGLVWLVLAVAMVGIITGATDSAPAPGVTTTVEVQAGDTLWDLAEGLVSGADRRVTVDQIMELNDLASAGAIRPGDVLKVPAGG